MALIKCEDVSIGYEGQTVVRNLNFHIDSGDYLCIVERTDRERALWSRVFWD